MKERFSQADEWEPKDITEELQDTEPELLRYLRRLPPQLWSRHFEAMQRISKMHADEDPAAIREQRINYLLNVLHSREKAIETFSTLDSGLQNTMEASEWGERLHTLLIERGNVLGSGMTARVKSLHLAGREDPIAVKYLLTPTTKTLSVEGEYDMSREVELVTSVETHEQAAGTGDRISLPHPLFYYKRGDLQCYGMQEILGMTLHELTTDTAGNVVRRDTILQAIKERYSSEESRKALFQEADAFVKAMHEVCLHGDIKLGNMMADENGRIYIIDFGQAVNLNNMSEDTREQFENLQEMERDQVHVSIQHLLKLCTDTQALMAA